MFFMKNVKDKTLYFLLVKNMAKDFSGSKNCSKTEYSSQNYRFVKLAFSF